MRDATARLFDEFAAAYRAGADPDLRAFLVRAGEDAPALAQLVDSFLAASEPPPPDPERVELMRAWVRGAPPLLELRKARRLRRGEVVARLTELLGFGTEREKAVAGYYHQLENGLLEPRRVDTRVWDALRQVLDADVRSLARWRPEPIQASYAYRVADAAVAAEYVPQRAEDTDEEVARLFLSGS